MNLKQLFVVLVSSGGAFLSGCTSLPAPADESKSIMNQPLDPALQKAGCFTVGKDHQVVCPIAKPKEPR